MGVTRRDASAFGLGMLAGVLLSVAAGIAFMFYVAVMMRQFQESFLEAPRFIAEKDRTEAPLDWTVTALDGREQKLGDLKGRVIFLNFWATWCGPCREEIPSLQTMTGRLKDKPVALLFVSREEAPVVSEFFKKKKLTLPGYTLQGDPPDELKTDGIPTTFIIDREGRIALKHVGGANWADEKVISAILTLTGETAAAPAALAAPGSPPGNSEQPAPVSSRAMAPESRAAGSAPAAPH